MANRIAQVPPIGWILRRTARFVASSQIGKTEQARESTDYVAHGDLTAMLHEIVTDVVSSLGYVAAMVATYEQDDSLTIHAYYADPNVADDQTIKRWETEISAVVGRPLSLTDPNIARVYVQQPEFHGNLSVKAFNSQKPQRDAHLFSLLTPVVPSGPAIEQVVQGIQEALNVREVIAVPFFLEITLDGKKHRELVGNLFALSRTPITESDEQVLSAFGRQAGAALLSERRRLQLQAVQQLIFDVQASLQDEAHILKRIVTGVVANLGYAAAMVATYEPDDSLPVRAYYVDPAIASDEQIRHWEDQVSAASGLPLSLSDPQIARVYVHQERYNDNLSKRAFNSQNPERDDHLFSLLTPIVPKGEFIERIVQGIQDALGVREVIAVPFFLETTDGDHVRREFVGNLFALSRLRQFNSGDIEALQAFGQQAAAGLRNARLYLRSEDRRTAAQIFGKMAFSASASVHALRNHVGVVRGNLQLLNMLDQFPEGERTALLKELVPPILGHLDQIADTLDTLHEPWRPVEDTLIDVNECLIRAIRKVVSERGDWLELDLAEDLPQINTAYDMMVELFRVLIKNAVDAIEDKGDQRHLCISSYRDTGGMIAISISDNGIGIARENIGKIFEMRWSTKKKGLGFGLFWAKDYIEGLKGHIAVTSELGIGTTFHITIPPASSQSRRDQGNQQESIDGN